MNESWAMDGVNYWENPNCPKKYLVNAMVNLLDFVEGEVVPHSEIEKMGIEELRKEVGFYEYVADK